MLTRSTAMVAALSYTDSSVIYPSCWPSYSRTRPKVKPLQYRTVNSSTNAAATGRARLTRLTAALRCRLTARTGRSRAWGMDSRGWRR